MFLNVFAPSNVQNLPILFWIHGGGYGAGDGDQDFGEILGTNNNSFIVVSIQYRLGAFGFLASDEVEKNGALNAGIRDQTFALQWVQDYIHLFGGDPRKVTIAGVSAGGGSVMLQAIAFGGEIGTSLFQNVSFLPMQKIGAYHVKHRLLLRHLTFRCNMNTIVWYRVKRTTPLPKRWVA